MKIDMKGYRLLTRAAAPAAVAYLLMRSRKQPAYRNYWGERFGFSEYPAPMAGPRIWVHAVSVGETNAAKSLIAALLKKWPKADVLLTHMTPTGRDAGRKIVSMAPERITQCYLPYDTPGAMRKFFTQTKPSAGIVMETEIWPTMMEEAKHWGVPMVLANARESEKSLEKALKVPKLMIPAVRQFDAILAQAESDAERFRRLGSTKTVVVGSMKFDIQPDPGQAARAKAWKQALGRSVVLIASTREGEELKLIEAFREQKAHDALVLLVPRHPQRFASVLQLIRNLGIAVQSRSGLKGPEDVLPETEILLGDSMGEMSFYCAMADAAVMGGSFLDYGCQNLIEPCAAGVPVILGPSTFNFAEVAANALKAGAAVQVKDFSEALEVSREWLTHPDLLSKRAGRALEFASSYTGATARTMDILEKLCKKESLPF